MPDRLPKDGEWPCQRPPHPDPPPRLLGALYILLRDHVHPGDMEQVLINVRYEGEGDTVFTNRHLEELVRAHATYLLED